MNPTVGTPPALPGPVAFSGKRGECRRRVARCSNSSPSDFTASGSPPISGVICGRIPRWMMTPFEYTGRGKELLIGFLFALAIIVPVYLAYFLVGLEAERFKAFASFSLIAFFNVFGKFAIYRVRRDRLTRTVWREKFFEEDGFPGQARQ